MSSLFNKPDGSQAVISSTYTKSNSVNLAEVANRLEELAAAVPEQTDGKLYVFDKNGVKILL